MAMALMVENLLANADVRDAGLTPGSARGNVYSSSLAWKIPWTKKPGGIWSVGSQEVRHDCV